MLFDSHAHLEDRQFDRDRDEVIRRAKESGVELIVNVGYNMKHIKKSLEISDKYPFIYSVIGLHPHDAKTANEDFWDELYRLSAHPKVVAIGEMGLDYFRDHSPRPVQREVFRRQINIARDLQMPIVIHDRDAHGDIMQIIKEENAREVGGVFHSYSGSWEMARELLKLGFYLSISGPVTYKNARKLVEVVEKAPLDRLLIETDCPYLTPHPQRGKRNEPALVRLTAERIAEIRGISFAEVASATLNNGKEVFRIRD